MLSSDLSCMAGSACTLWTLQAKPVMSHRGSLLSGCIFFFLSSLMQNSTLGLFYERLTSKPQSISLLHGYLPLILVIKQEVYSLL